MSRFYRATIRERRAFGKLIWLELEAPELAAHLRPGQALLVRPADMQSADPLLRATIFHAGSNAKQGTITFLLSDGEEFQQAWLLQYAYPSSTLDIYGPVGRGFELDPRTGNLLLVGEGPGLAALVALTQQAVARRISVVLLAAASHSDYQIPAFLLPPDVEYQFTTGPLSELLEPLAGSKKQPLFSSNAPIVWADQACVSLDPLSLQDFVQQLRAQRLRWTPGFAFALMAEQLACGSGACFGCMLETRNGWQLRCKDGPIFDLKRLA